jgi:hypothetical protein
MEAKTTQGAHGAAVTRRIVASGKFPILLFAGVSSKTAQFPHGFIGLLKIHHPVNNYAGASLAWLRRAGQAQPEP